MENGTYTVYWKDRPEHRMRVTVDDGWAESLDVETGDPDWISYSASDLEADGLVFASRMQTL